ncbi:MAG TPA: methyl-accepting chemotaxis protein [Arenibaculum sp.]|nr:methyl-accepting chemotaxis protein [Arenibaculum sp.]
MPALNFSLRAKLWALVAAACAASFAIAGAGLYLNHDRMYQDRVASLRHMVEAGHTMAARFESDAAAGRMTREEAQARFKEALLAIRYAGQEYLFAHTYDVTGFAHPSDQLMDKDVSGIKDAGGKPIVTTLVQLAKTHGEGTYAYDWPRTPGGDDLAIKLAYYKAFDPWNIFIGTGVFIDDIQADFLRQLWTLLAMIAALALPAIALIALVGNGISRTIRELSGKMLSLAGGDLSVTFPEAGRRDELGAMGKAVQVFKENAHAKIRLEAEHAAAARHADEEKRRAMHQLADGFEKTIGGMIRSISGETGGMETATHEMTRAAEKTQSLASAVAAATEQTSANVQTVASAAEELSGSIGEIGRQVGESSRIAREAADIAGRANTRVAGLAEAVEKIGAVVQLINDIASQTNLLALNATIEAARAGEAGKGFAVVASEVKTLANQTARATEEIASQVAAIQSVTGEAVREIHDVTRVIGQVNEVAVTIASAVEEQGAATREISRNVQQAAHGTQEVTNNIADVSTATDRNGETANALLEAARRLAVQTSTLNEEVATFLGTVRSA